LSRKAPDARLAFHHVVVKRYNDVNRVKNIVKGAEAEQGTSSLDMHGDCDALFRAPRSVSCSHSAYGVLSTQIPAKITCLNPVLINVQAAIDVISVFMSRFYSHEKLIERVRPTAAARGLCQRKKWPAL
jgi:hypothetical protein